MKKVSNTRSDGSLILEKLPAYFLLVAIFWVAWQLFVVVRPFMMVLMLSVVVASITFPLYAKFETWLKGKKRLASLVTCLLVIFVIVVPLSIFFLLLALEAIDLYYIVYEYLRNFDIAALLKWDYLNSFYDLFGSYSDDVAIFVQQNMDNLRNGLIESAKFVSTFVARQGATILTDVGLTIFNLFLMFFTLYFLYKDGRFLLRWVMQISPLPVRYEKEIYREFNEISKSTLLATFLTAIAQGMVGWIGFVIAGVSHPVFWGIAVAVFSIVPAFGTSIIWFPMGFIMLISGSWWGLFILLWGLILVSTVDNVLRIVFVNLTYNMNPLLVFITVFGGMLAFGLIGVIFGPILLVLFLTLLHIYRLEYAGRLGEDEEVGLQEPTFDK